MDNHKTLSLRGDQDVKYADVVSGEVGMTMMVLVSGRSRAEICPPFLIFQNALRSYPIRSLPDNVPGVSYRSEPKGWIDRIVMAQWRKEPRAISLLPGGRRRVLYMDNCSGHGITDEIKSALESINTEVRIPAKNANDLVEPADSFVIQKINTTWRRRWDDHKLTMIDDVLWIAAKNASGKLANPGKKVFLKLASDSVRDVNVQGDKDGISLSPKSMVRWRLGTNMNGKWEERQLFPRFQEIINKYRDNFDRAPVNGDEVEENGESADEPLMSTEEKS